MTIDQKVEIYRMRLEGATLDEIAQKFGVTRQHVSKITPPLERRAKKKRLFESCLYPNIAKWMHENRYSYNSFARLLCVTPDTVFNGLTGKVDMRKRLIDRILDATSMSYEYAFYQEKDRETDSQKVANE